MLLPETFEYYATPDPFTRWLFSELAHRGLLWLPRFAYQRSRTTGEWTTDSVGACWVIWVKPYRSVHCGPGHPDFGKARDQPAAAQFIRYAPESVIDELDAFTPRYRQLSDGRRKYAMTHTDLRLNR